VIAGKEGRVTPEYLLRIAAGWSCLTAVQSIYADYKRGINATDWCGETALLKTCRAGHLDVVQWLLTTAKADAGVKTKKMHYAIALALLFPGRGRHGNCSDAEKCWSRPECGCRRNPRRQR